MIARYQPCSPGFTAKPGLKALNAGTRRKLHIACGAQEPCSKVAMPPVFSCPGSLSGTFSFYSFLHSLYSYILYRREEMLSRRIMKSMGANIFRCAVVFRGSLRYNEYIHSSIKETEKT